MAECSSTRCPIAGWWWWRNSEAGKNSDNVFGLAPPVRARGRRPVSDPNPVVWLCYRCGYNLLGDPKSTVCSECGSADHAQRQHEARDALRHPVQLAFRSLALWHPLPPALWANGADNLFSRTLQKNHSFLIIGASVLSAFLLLLVATVRFHECSVVEPNPRSMPRIRTTLPYVQMTDFNLWGVHLHGPADLSLLKPDLPSALHNWPYPAECRDGVQWLRKLPAIPLMTRRTVAFAILPVISWTSTFLFLRIWTRNPATPAELSNASSSREAALSGIQWAAWSPILLTWIIGLNSFS